MPFKPDEGNREGAPGVPFNKSPAAIIAPGPYSSGQPTSAVSRELAATALEESVQQGQVINYYFPVEIEVPGTLDEVEVQRIARYVYDELITALQSQAPRVE